MTSLAAPRGLRHRGGIVVWVQPQCARDRLVPSQRRCLPNGAPVIPSCHFRMLRKVAKLPTAGPCATVRTMDEVVCLSLDGQAGDQFAWSLLCHVMLGRNERRDLGKPRRRNRRHRGNNRRSKNYCGPSVAYQRQKNATGICDEPHICLPLRDKAPKPNFGDSPKFKQPKSLQVCTDRPFGTLALRVAVCCTGDPVQFAILRRGEFDTAGSL